MDAATEFVAQLRAGDTTAVLVAAVAALTLLALVVKSLRKPSRPAVQYTTIKRTAVTKRANDDGADNEAEAGKPKILFLFGSQTGTAEDYARRLANEARRFGFRARVADMEVYDHMELDSESFVFIVISTYGDGEPPDSAAEFYEWIGAPDRSSDLLKDVNFVVFSLGSKTYHHYQAMGRFMDKRFAELGARRLYERGEGNDQRSLEDDFMAWRGDMWDAVCAHYGIDPANAAQENVLERRFNVVFHDSNNPAPPPPRFRRDPLEEPDVRHPMKIAITENRELHQAKSDRSCRHIEFDIARAPMHYFAGDHLGVVPTNPTAEVEALAKRLNIDLDVLFTMRPKEFDGKKGQYPLPCSMRDALTNFADILGALRKGMVQALAEYAQDAKEKAKLQAMCGSSLEAQAEFKRYIVEDERSLLEVLNDFPSIQVPHDHLLELLPPLAVRYYSISSSPKVTAGRVTITAVVVDWQTRTGRHARGVATSYLAPLAAATTVPIFVRHSTFKYPADYSTPILMIGPGTGLAPFRGFLQERQALRVEHQLGPAYLYFGCRARDVDYLYREELEAAERSGVLTKLYTAFSRETAKKVYVQDLLAEHGAEVWRVLSQQKGMLYVCGDGAGMATGVNKALHEIAMKHGKLDERGAAAFFGDLRDSHRYLQDVW